MEPHEIIMYPLMGEKATGLREAENKLSFIVNDHATKNDVKEAIEKLYNVTVTKVNIMVTQDGLKKAHIKLDEKHSADEIASHFGVL